MNRIFEGIFDCVKRKKGYFLLLIIASVLAVVLGVVAAVNFGDGVFTIDLSHIAYIKFLKAENSFMSMIFGLFLSLLVFFAVIFLCHYKSFLIPLGFLFYLYLVYSQAVIFVSVILIYGILNCVILAILLFVYSLLVWAIFLLMITELSCFTNFHGYFKTCFSFKESKVVLFLVALIVLTFIFSLILMILKNYVILLIF